MTKTVLITGSSRGIGASIALKMASVGYNVIINYKDHGNEALEVKKKIENLYNVKTLIVKADISKESDVKNMFDVIKNEFGMIDVLVNNAGLARDADYLDKTVLEFREVLDVNLVGTFLVTKYATLIMNKGSIINITSNGALDDNYPYSMDYDASKAGVISLTHNFAKRLSPNIRVNALALGWINTDMNKGINEEFIRNELDKILLGRIGETEEVAGVVAFLASDDASYINNSVIRVDGGLR